MRKSTRMMMITGREGLNNRRDYGRSEERMYGGEMSYPRMNDNSRGRGNYGGRNRGNYGANNRMENEYESTRNEYNGSGMNYGVEGRFRDRRGREHYDDGRFAPMRSEMDEDDMEGHYTPYYPSPVWGDPGMGIMAGFNGERGFRSDAGYPRMNEMESRHGMMQSGGARGMEVMPMDKRTAEEWLHRMKNTDGTVGPHWTMDKIKQVAQQKGIQGDPLELYVAMNMMYSDYGKAAMKHGLQNNIDYWLDMAQAFLDDQDAMPDKLSRYYEYIVQK